MELTMLFIALFAFFFGSVIVTKTFEYGLRLGDAALIGFGRLMLLPFRVGVKLIKIGALKLISSRPTDVSVKPIISVTPLELQHIRNNRLRHSGSREPVLIEYTQQTSK
jgi:hypothetical protein